MFRKFTKKLQLWLADTFSPLQLMVLYLTVVGVCVVAILALPTVPSLIVLGVEMVIVAFAWISSKPIVRRQCYKEDVEQYGQALADDVFRSLGWDKWWEKI